MKSDRPSDGADTQQFLFRPRPIEGESLSSWRQRCALENGFAIYPRRRGEAWRTEPDKVDAVTLTWLARSHAIDESEVARLQLRATELGGISAPASQWITPLRYTASAKCFGPVACTECQAEDREPYFRISWRYAFVTACPKHDVLLKDRCSRCDGLLWPNCAVRPSLFKDKSLPLNKCAHCGHDLRLAENQAAVAFAARAIAEGLRQGQFDVEGQVLGASEFMDGLAFVAQLHLWSPSASRLRPLVGLQAQGKARTAALPRSVEQLEVSQRHEVVLRSMELLAGWPERFFAKLSAVKLDWQHVSGIGRRAPPWMATVLRERLSRQRRGITTNQVRNEASRLLQAGLLPTKAAVARSLGCREAGAIDRLLARRTTATREELRVFVKGLSAQVDRSFRRRSSRAIAARNCALAAFQVLSGEDRGGDRSLTPRTLIAAVERLDDRSDDSNALVKLARTCVAIWLDCGADLWGAHLDQAFRGVRKPVVSNVSIQVCIRRAMQTIDPRLLRDPTVFSDCLKTT